MTERINDDGWDQSYVRWLMGSRLRRGDAVLVFSVGGGDAERHVSNNLVESLRLAREVGAKIYGIVGRDRGFTAKYYMNDDYPTSANFKEMDLPCLRQGR